MRYRLTPEAERDLERTLTATLRLFGPRQVVRYAEIVKQGLGMIAADPFRPASQDRTELRPGIRSFHLQHAARRIGGAAHIVYYRLGTAPDGEAEIVVGRILPEEMEPLRRVARALRRE